jgi:hypothetical protein
MRALPLLLLISACGSYDIDLTSDATTIDAVGHANGDTTVSVCPGPSGLFSCGSDRFRVTLGDVTREPVLAPLSFGPPEATFAVASGTVTATRVSDGASGHVDLPAPIGAVQLERTGDGVRLRWQKVGDRVRWSVARDCPDGYTIDDSGRKDDGGQAFIPASKIPSGCTVTVTLRRERDGILDAAFPAGSTITGAQDVEMVVNSPAPGASAPASE